MEFFDISRYFKIDNPEILPFSELRNMKPVELSHELKLINEPSNIEYAKSLAEKGLTVVKIKKIPPSAKYKARQTFPNRVILEMTSRCNFLTCRMCPQNNLKRPLMDMAGETYRKLIDEVDYYGVDGLWLYHLGESLLHPEFHENINHIKNKKNLGTIWLSTNGELFTEDIIKVIMNSNIDFINFSAHAVTEETYKKVINKDVFHIVQENLHTFYKLKGSENLPRKPFLHCQMIEQEPTRHEVDAFIEKHYKYADIVSINMLEYVNLPGNSFGLKQRERKKLESCLRVKRGDCFIFSNGHVTLCDVAYNGEIDLGNIYEETIYEIWNGKKRNKFLELNRNGTMGEIEFCRMCTDYDI